jgi:hypothetical protein
MNLSSASILDMIASLRDGTLTQSDIWNHFDRVSNELDTELQAYNFRTKEQPVAQE